MRYLQKLLDRPDLYLICLPEQSNEVTVDVYVRSGRLYEPDQLMGIGHMMDHYINGQIYAKYLDRLTTNAWINQEHIQFRLVTTKKNAARDIPRFLKAVLTPDFTNEELFLFERQSIVNEMRTEYSSFAGRQLQLMRRERFLPGSTYRRPTYNEIHNVAKIELSHLKLYHQHRFSQAATTIFLGAHKPAKNFVKDMMGVVKGYQLSGYPLPPCPSQYHSSHKIVSHREKDVAGQEYVGINFPGLTTKESLAERLAVRMICRIMTGTSRYSAFPELRSSGIYAIDYINYSYPTFGFLAFIGTIPPQRLEEFVRIVSAQIRRFKEVPLPKAFLETRLRPIKNYYRNIWGRNIDSYDFLVDTILEGEQVPGSKELLTELKEITPKFVQQVARKVFDKKCLNLFIAGEVPPISTEKLEKLLDF